eukprot:gene34651-45584_t
MRLPTALPRVLRGPRRTAVVLLVLVAAAIAWATARAPVGVEHGELELLLKQLPTPAGARPAADAGPSLTSASSCAACMKGVPLPKQPLLQPLPKGNGNGKGKGPPRAEACSEAAGHTITRTVPAQQRKGGGRAVAGGADSWDGNEHRRGHRRALPWPDALHDAAAVSGSAKRAEKAAQARPLLERLLLLGEGATAAPRAAERERQRQREREREREEQQRARERERERERAAKQCEQQRKGKAKKAPAELRATQAKRQAGGPQQEKEESDGDEEERKLRRQNHHSISKQCSPMRYLANANIADSNGEVQRVQDRANDYHGGGDGGGDAPAEVPGAS